MMENPIKMDDLGGNPTIFGNIHIRNLTTKEDGYCDRLMTGQSQWMSMQSLKVKGKVEVL